MNYRPHRIAVRVSEPADTHHVVHDEPDDDFILRPGFNPGIKALSRYPLCYDILSFEHHLPQTITFVDQHPGLRMVVDHVAKPRTRRDAFDGAWAANIKRLAVREHVACKLSGMVAEVEGDRWDAALLKPYLETVLGAFGPERIMFGSDWPVCLTRSTHTQWVETVQSLIAPLTPSEQEAIMGGHARASVPAGPAGRRQRPGRPESRHGERDVSKPYRRVKGVGDEQHWIAAPQSKQALFDSPCQGEAKPDLTHVWEGCLSFVSRASAREGLVGTGPHPLASR